MRKLLAILVLVAVVVFLAACRNVANGPAIYIPPEGPIQLEDPQIGDTIAIIHTNLGDITIRLFPQYAPRAVENFTTLAESGWYDGLTFYRVLQEFVIQAGQPNTQYSIWSGPFMAEWDAPLHHIRGAVGLAAYMGLSVSSFYIVQNSDMDNETPMRHNFRHYIENPDTVLYDADGNPFIITDRFPIPILEYYVEHGGMWRLDYPGLGFNTQRLAIFGQVIEGMEIVDVISQMPTTGPEGSPANRPLEDTIITTITISRYNNWR